MYLISFSNYKIITSNDIDIKSKIWKALIVLPYNMSKMKLGKNEKTIACYVNHWLN